MTTKKTGPAMDIASLQEDAEQQAKNQAARFDLKTLTALGEDLERLNNEAEQASRALDAKLEQIRVLETETIPEMLRNIGLKSLTLASGAKISLVDVINASISDDNREAAHTWLREHGHGDIIKNNVTLSFGKGEDAAATKLIKTLLQMRDKGKTSFGDVVQKEQVHPQTLKAFVKDQLSKGEAFPAETFKLYVGQAVKMTK